MKGEYFKMKNHGLRRIFSLFLALFMVFTLLPTTALAEDTTGADETQPKTVEAMGVTLAVSPAIFDDLDMVEYLYDLQTAQSGDGAGAFAIVPFLKKLCGPQYTAMKDALRDPDTGRVSIDKVSEFIAQLLEQVAPNS